MYTEVGTTVKINLTNACGKKHDKKLNNQAFNIV